ncbi:cubilin-like [Haliotis cracherodii]|uniref:cubilin-like n=1 Tax=Haliotis cracherodii TaxID=6455 RepID=UPI0039E8CA42
MPFPPYLGVATVLAGLCLVLVCDAEPHSHLNWLRMSSLRKKRQAQSSSTAPAITSPSYTTWLAGTRAGTTNTLGYDRDTTTNSTYTCDRVYRTTSGILDSYSVSRVALAQDMDCEYIVRPPYYPFLMTMYFSRFFMPYNFTDNNGTCSGSYVEINGTQYCGTVYGQYHFSSEEPELPVRYHHSVNSVTRRREVFHIYFSTSPVSCNITLTDTAGYINSYSGHGYASVYRRSYNDGTHCIFTIKVDDDVGQTIVFSLNQFHLEDPDNSTSVCNDYVDMNGEERLCGYQYGTRSFNFDGTFVVTFISDNNQTNVGFNIRYKIVPAGCLVTYNTTEGTLISPLASSGLYHNNLDCRYTMLTSYTQTKVTVTVNAFDLESPSYSSSYCYNDYVSYSDGSYTSGRYCGAIAAGTTFTWYTNARQFDFVFHTNNEISRQGFNASYTIEEDICDELFTDSNGTIRSPVYSTGLYRRNLNCTYIIRPPTQGLYRFNLTYSQFDVQRMYYNSSSYSLSTSCSYDFVETKFSGFTGTSRLCGRMRSPRTYFYNSLNGDVVIKFVTNGNIERRGFVLNYSYDENSCYQVLTDADGQIQVPDDGSTTYSPNLDCLFTIRPPAGRLWVVNITLEEFDVESYYSYYSNSFSTSCSKDYIQMLYDGYSSSRMCGTRTSPKSYIYNIYDSDVNITFHSDDSVQRNGFNISFSYTENTCVTDLDQNNGTIRSPVTEGGVTYPADTLCIYYLDLGDSLKTVTFTVRVFDVNCGDYFIVNGQRFCGNRLTQTTFHMTGRVNMTFLSNSYRTGRGVDVDYLVTNYTCDRVYRTTSGILDSYSVSRVALAQDMDCEYIVRPPYYPFLMTMYFSRFFMPYNFTDNNGTCSGSYVEINGIQYCGTVYGQYNFSSEEPELPVRYHHSVNSVTGRREVFHIYYNTRPVSCNITVTDTAGYINSYSGHGYASVYRRSYNDGTHCIFTINVDDVVDQTIVFSLNQFHLEDPDNSTSVCNDYVDMNGEERLCGYQYGTRSFNFDGTFVVTFISDNNQTNVGFNMRYNIVPAGCLVTYNTTEGTLISPLASSGLYHNNLDCRYTMLTSYTQTKVTVTVNAFDLESPSYSSGSCDNDYIYFSDGSYTSGRYCGAIAAGTTFTWYTNARQFDFVFHTNNKISRQGFNASYTIEEDICDELFTDSNGTIRSPVYSTGLYRRNLNCTYIIRPPTQGLYRFNLTYSQFDVQRMYYNSSSYSLSTSCSYDFVETKFSGLTGTSRLCGRMRSPRTYFYNSLNGDVVIKFVTNGNIERRGFVLNYSYDENSCYQVLTDADGQIQVPDDGSTTYSPNLDCLFTIRPPAGRLWVVNITLEEFDVESYYSYYSNSFSTSCSKDYIQMLYDGYSSSRMCGTRTSPKSYIYNIYDSDVNITFHSDDSVQRNGFNISFSYTENTCVTDLDQNNGTIRSPVTEGGVTYPADTLCIYYLDLGDSLKTVTFTVRVFDVNCGDYFIVNGQRFCGNRLTQTTFHMTGRVNMTFLSNSYRTGRGVDVDYLVTNYTCDRVYRTTSGILDSYSVSRVALAQDMDCEYIVRPPYYPFLMTMYFSRFFMPYNFTDNNGTCSGSYVEINGIQYCGTVYGQYNFSSEEPELPVRYHHSVNSVTGRREVFHIYYNTRPVSCNITLTDTAGYINSYSGHGYASVYRRSYNDGTHCIFTINVDDVVDQTIVFSLNQFHLEDPDNSTSVCNDYVDMNGEERLCGYQYGTRSFNFDGTFVVTFISDNNQTNVGFNMRYNIVPARCLVTYNTTEGTLISPLASSGLYHNNLDCRYTMLTSYTQTKVTVTVNAFDLESPSYSSGSCDNDYIYFSDGSYTSGRYCGAIAAGTTFTWYTNARQFDFVFHTNNKISRQGFNASYTIEEDICDELFTDSNGTIRSPVYSTGLYRRNLNCTYIIRPPTQGLYRFNLTYSQFDVQRMYYNSSSYSLSTSCSYDFVETKFSGLTGTSRLCGRMRSPRTYFYNSLNGDVVIKFVTNGNIERRGFVLNYSYDENSCYQVLTDADGQIQVPDDGSTTYSPNLDCLFTIRPPAGRLWVVNITLEEFDVERYYSSYSNSFSTSCSKDYIQMLYDGYSSSRMCGTRTSPKSYIYNIYDSDVNITFHSDDSVQRNGFNISFSYTENTCVTDLDQNTGTIRSPVIEGGVTYPADTLCIYYLDLGDSLKTVTFTVRVFDVNCGDYFIVNGQRFCGNRLTQTTFHMTGRVNMTFLSNSYRTGRGVDADYLVTNYTCDRVYRSTSGNLDSYTVSRLPLAHEMDCEYIIRPPYYPFILTMYFSPFYMPYNFMSSNGTCSGSYVEINGIQYCGTVYGQYNFSSEEPELPVRYHHSVNSVTGRREVFHIYYNTRPVSCNITLTDTAGYINSYSGYGYASVFRRSYNDGTHCIFTINVDDVVDQTIVFSLNQFHLEDPDNSTSVCNDYVDMNGEERLCGYQYGTRSFNFDGTFVVTFISDNNQTNVGFNIRYKIVPAGCLVTYNTTEGTLISPLASSGLYHNNLDCRYTMLTSYTQTKVTVTVNAFDLESSSYSSSYCYNDYVSYSDGSYTSGRYCGAIAAGTTFTWYTNARQFNLILHTNSEISRQGFNMSYRVEEDLCDKLFTDSNGIITSPVYSTGLYRNNLNCTYIIRPPTQGPYRFTLTYSQFDVQRTYYNSSSYSLSTSCSYDYVETKFSGLTGTSRLCGRMRSPRTYFYNAFGGDFVINFVADRSILRRGFVMVYSYEQNSCYQVLTDAVGQIQVPDDGSATYSPNLDCLFTIRPPAGGAWAVNITLEDFDVQRYYSSYSNSFSTSCSMDYVQVLYDGYTSSRMCGTRISPISYIHNIVDGDLNITFHSDSSTQKRGVLIRYSYTENICDYVFTDSYGVIESPNGGNYYYQSNTLCRYTIIGGNALYTVFYNISYFDLYYSRGCSGDYLQFPDGQRYCGTYMRNISYSTVGNTSLTFRSDASYSRRGFRLHYKVLPFNCSRVYTEQGGMISDPDLSGVDFSGDIRCDYTFLVPFYPFIVTFTPLLFGLQDAGTDGVCTTEYVSQDGDRFCGQRNESWQAISGDNTMELHYFSTGAVRGNYSVLYHVTPGMCNMTYTGRSGSISGNMSSDISNSTCYYRIQNNMAASQIHIRLVSDAECNYLDFDGLERRCGNNGTSGTEISYAYDGDFLITLFHAPDMEAPSFQLYYNIVPENCIQRFTSDTGSFASPADTDGNYVNDLACSYTISGGSSPYVLLLNFVSLDLQYSSYCNNDYVRFSYRGSSGYNTTTSRYCTGPRSLRYSVSSGDFKVSFVTDSREVRSGFNVTYVKTPVSCNLTYTADEGTIESTPGDGSYYPNNAYCTYTVQGNSSLQTLQLTVQTFSLEAQSSCRYDSLQFGSTSSRKYCGSSLYAGGVLTYTFRNNFILYFKTDGSVTRRGFVINYKKEPYVPTTTTTTTTAPPTPNCNATFTASNGQLRSPNSPREYPNNIYCRYTFVGSGQTQSITLDFTSFAVENHASCRWDWVIISGGNKRCGFTEFSSTYTFVGNFTVEFRTDGSVTYSGFVANYVVSDASDVQNTTSNPIWLAPNNASDVQNTTSNPIWLASNNASDVQNTTSNPIWLASNNANDVQNTTSNPIWLASNNVVASDVQNTTSNPIWLASNNGACGTTLTSSTGRIYYPTNANYTNNVRCQVTIRPGAGQTFNVTFTDFDLESHPSCNHDSLEFQMYGVTSTKNCGRNRAGLTLSFPYTSGDIVVNFSSDSSVTGRGFDLNYQVT